MSFADVTVHARRVLLDALEALRDHREALVLVGAQAVYLYTGEADVPIATRTKDADLAIVPGDLRTSPALQIAMKRAGFHHDVRAQQPGVWISHDGYPVELLVPGALHDGGGRRGARIPPHSKRSARVVVGLEAAAVDNAWREITALDPEDARVIPVRVASPAALVVAKVYKIGDRRDTSPSRLLDKDAHDLYRLLRATDGASIVAGLSRLTRDPLAGPVTQRAVKWIRELCETPQSLIPVMAGRAEELVGNPGDVAEAAWALTQEILDGLPD